MRKVNLEDDTVKIALERRRSSSFREHRSEADGSPRDRYADRSGGDRTGPHDHSQCQRSVPRAAGREFSMSSSRTRSARRASRVGRTGSMHSGRLTDGSECTRPSRWKAGHALHPGIQVEAGDMRTDKFRFGTFVDGSSDLNRACERAASIPSSSRAARPTYAASRPLVVSTTDVTSLLKN